MFGPEEGEGLFPDDALHQTGEQHDLPLVGERAVGVVGEEVLIKGQLVEVQDAVVQVVFLLVQLPVDQSLVRQQTQDSVVVFTTC